MAFSVFTADFAPSRCAEEDTVRTATTARPGWHYFDGVEEMEGYPDMGCPECEGLGLPVAAQARRPRNFIESLVPRVRVLYACEDCEHEFIEEIGR